ncbi:MAG: hypothetical protein JRD89_12235 [Deltaproteobacteria bacterium]|nr:hypothetical protein [Deltaproteobacteria bacterium]
MAATTFANCTFAPAVYSDALILESLTLNAFAQSGVFQTDPTVRNFLTSEQAGTIYIRRFDPLAEGEGLIPSDTGSAGAVGNITMSSYAAIKQALVHMVGSADIIPYLNDEDPMEAIQMGMAKWWSAIWNRRAIASMTGILADNIAADNEDMVNDISSATFAGITVANTISASAIVAAERTMGDRGDGLGVMCVHSAIYYDLKDNDLIDYLEDSKGDKTIATYRGYRLVVDDALPAVTYDTSAIKYTTYLVAPGALAVEVTGAKVPVAVERDEKANNGGGTETLIERNNFIIHPYGFSWIAGSVADANGFPTEAELALAANWNRIDTRKRIGIAAIISNSLTQV